MSDPVLGEVLMVSFNFAPKGYALCNGQLLNIADYPALYGMLGTSYGGDGITQFALPDLRGRVPVAARMPGTVTEPEIAMGAKGGEELHVLTNDEYPVHSHPMFASSDLANEAQPTGNVIAAVAPDDEMFAPISLVSDQILGSGSVSANDGGEAHNNMQPSFVVNFCIAVEGSQPPTGQASS